jgi:hypothetical protein
LLDICISIIAYKTINLDWLKELRESINAHIIIIIDDPEDNNFKQYCESYLINSHSIGFGKARRLSMMLGSEYCEYCITTDGDGQYPIKSIEKLIKTLTEKNTDIVIPQRIKRKVELNYKSKKIDRRQFEKLETLCALEILKNKQLDINLDTQPGMFGFRSSIINKIIPDDSGWLADFEITIKALKETNYILIYLPIDIEVQCKTNFTIKSQIKKLKRIKNIFKIDIKRIFEKEKEIFETPEVHLIDKILMNLYKEE